MTSFHSAVGVELRLMGWVDYLRKTWGASRHKKLSFKPRVGQADLGLFGCILNATVTLFYKCLPSVISPLQPSYTHSYRFPFYNEKFVTWRTFLKFLLSWWSANPSPYQVPWHQSQCLTLMPSSLWRRWDLQIQTCGEAQLWRTSLEL